MRYKYNTLNIKKYLNENITDDMYSQMSKGAKKVYLRHLKKQRKNKSS